MKKLLLTLAAIFAIATPLYFIATADAREQATQDAHENAEENAKYIVDQLYDEATITAVRRIRDQEQIQQTETFLQGVGGELIDPDAFVDAWAGDIFIRYADAAAAVYFDLYLELIPPAQLAEIAVFHRSNAGQAMLELNRRDRVSMETNEDQNTGWLGRVSPIHMPALTMFYLSQTRRDWDAREPVLTARAKEQLADAAALMEQEYTASTKFSLLVREDLVTYEDPEMRDYLVWALTGGIGPEPPKPKQLGDPALADTE